MTDPEERDCCIGSQSGEQNAERGNSSDGEDLGGADPPDRRAAGNRETALGMVGQDKT